VALSYRTGVLTGIGLSLVAALVLPRWGRPLTKATVKGGLAAYETASETLAQLRETLADLTAEAAYERAAARAPAADRSPAAARPAPAEQEPLAAG
jgi:hypothetical protein